MPSARRPWLRPWALPLLALAACGADPDARGRDGAARADGEAGGADGGADGGEGDGGGGAAGGGGGAGGAVDGGDAADGCFATGALPVPDLSGVLDDLDEGADPE